MNADMETIADDSSVRPQRRSAGRGLTRLLNYAIGKEILVLGPSGAGKTKFTDYLRLGALDPEGKREMTYHIRKTPSFVVGLGPNKHLALKVRRAVDTPGQVGPWQHGKLVGRRRPHAVIVVLDSTTALSTTVAWLRLFCSRLDTVLRDRSYVKRKLSEIVVLLNKRDQIDNQAFHELRQGVKAVLEQHLSLVLGPERVQSIPVVECISIQTDHGTKLIDYVISYLTHRLTEGPKLGARTPPTSTQYY